MTLASFIAYVLALFLASTTPGPAMLAVISTGITRGARPALALGLGIALSDVVLVSVVVAGLSVIAQTFGSLFFVIKYAGAIYLIILGYRMWRTDGGGKGQMPAVQADLARQVVLGAAIGFGNPKAILFHASLMPLILDIGRLDMFGIATLLMTVLLVNIVSMGGYAVLSGASSRWFRTPGAARAINRVAGGAMIGTGVLIAARA